MTPADEAAASDRFERERRDADTRYNDALTALDRAIVSAQARPAFDRTDFAALATALIVFLQQITAFVESKDREIAAAADAKIADLSRALASLAELRAQMTVVQRALHALSRAQPTAPGTAAHGSAAPGTVAPGTAAPGTAAPGTLAPGTLAPGTLAPALYVAFEDEFRGSDASISEKVRSYVPIFAGATHPVIDLGCGRGELLAALAAAGVPARGVDANAEMAAIARERGLDAVHGDALAWLESLPEASLGGVVATQVVEHLEPPYLTRLLEVAWSRLRPGAPIVLETINPACWLAFFSSYIRDLTHVRPVHPDTLQYLLRASGFERVVIRYNAPVPDAMKMRTYDVPAELRASSDPLAIAVAGLAHTINANAVVLNALMFSHLDYAAIGYRA